MDLKKIKSDLIVRLSPLEPESVILFGSFAEGNASEDSDIDLYVVTNDDFIPENFHQSNQVYLTVARTIRDLRKKMPIDLIVHTKRMNEKFRQMNSYFSREIYKKGIRLI